MKKTGTIEALNVSPKGLYEGFLLRTGKRIVQINLRKDEFETTGSSLKAGARVTADVEPEEPRGVPQHPVYKLISLRGSGASAAKGKQLGAGEFSGRVVSLNYARHGEINGGILESGDFLHLKPEGARALAITVGMKVQGSGGTRPMVGGHSVIEADEVNGIAVRHHAAKKKHAVKKHPKH